MSYNNESMRTQTDLEAMRMYPNNFLGSDNIDGAEQTIKEILSNSVDEANSGHGTGINISIYKDGSISIEDFGRGLPMDFNKKEDKYNWEIALCTLHGGGKFKDARDSYNSSSGQHGIGASAMQLSSEFCNVISNRDGYTFEMNFSKGVPIDKLKKTKNKDKTTGTKITWKPDAEVFTNIDFRLDNIKEWVKLQAIVNGGISFNLKDERVEYSETFVYKEGIQDYAKEITTDNLLSDLTYFECTGIGKDTPKRPSYEVKGRVVYGFAENGTNLYFHNSIPLEYGGSPRKAMEDAFVEFFTKRLKKDKKLKSDLKFEDIGENLIFISNTTTQVPPSFENQTKKAISNKFIQEFLTTQILISLNNWAKETPMEFEKTCNQIIINNESRTAAINHRAITKQKLKKNISGMKNKVPNFVGCRSKKAEEKELYICEGLSALGSLKQARNPDYQALYPIRGKIKSVYKAKQADALSNELVKNIIQLIGTGVNTKTTKCDIDAINFNKIVIATDFDSDGKHITSLLVTLFYTFMPEVIEKGYLYWLKTPLFEIDFADGSRKFAYSDIEKEEMIKGKKCKVSRNKGLGEIDAKDMKICLDNETQQLVRFTIKDAENAKYFMDLFMGNNADVRKDFIVEHSAEYDISELVE